MDAHSGTDAAAPRRLVLVRHAKSDWDTGRPDHERPLAARGRRDAAALGRWLATQVGVPDLVLCSSAVRTRETWARAVAAAPALAAAPVRVVDAIYRAWPDALLELVQAVDDDDRTVVLVGHAPGVPDLADRLNRATGTGPVGEFRTSAVAVLDVAGPWSDLGPGTATLTASEVPRG